MGQVSYLSSSFISLSTEADRQALKTVQKLSSFTNCEDCKKEEWQNKNYLLLEFSLEFSQLLALSSRAIMGSQHYNSSSDSSAVSVRQLQIKPTVILDLQ